MTWGGNQELARARDFPRGCSGSNLVARPALQAFFQQARTLERNLSRESLLLKHIRSYRQGSPSETPRFSSLKVHRTVGVMTSSQPCCPDALLTHRLLDLSQITPTIADAYIVRTRRDLPCNHRRTRLPLALPVGGHHPPPTRDWPERARESWCCLQMPCAGFVSVLGNSTASAQRTHPHWHQNQRSR